MSLTGVLQFALFVATGITGALALEGPDLDALADKLDGSVLAFDRAVDAAGFELPIDYGGLRLEAGVLVPAAIEGRTDVFEVVFVGKGQLRFAIDDSVERQQLAHFSGRQDLDAPVERAVLTLGNPSALSEVLQRPRVEVDPAKRAEAEKLFGQWVEEVERAGFGADTALLRAAVDDSLGRGFVGIWFDSSRVGRGFYRIDPSRFEPVSLGAFKLFHEEELQTSRDNRIQARTERTRRKLEQKLGRNLGEWFEAPADDDENSCGRVDQPEPEEELDRTGEVFDWIQPWVSTQRPDADPTAEPPGVEAQHYEIRLALSGSDLNAKGEARVRIRAVTAGQVVIPMVLNPVLDVCEILGDDDMQLGFRRVGWQVLVALPEPLHEDETMDLLVRFAGRPVRHRLARRHLVDTVHWHPHVGSRDQATYDVTLRWPESLKLLASGHEVDGGVDGGVRWTHRILDQPTLGFSFEIGDFDVLEDQVGHIELTFGFDRRNTELTQEIREEIVRAVKASILLFESRLGHLPQDYMTVVMVDRGFSQGLLGFLTLSESAMQGGRDGLVGLVDVRSLQGKRLETIAHEVSHQWWGHRVGWDSYRDQWLSESLATFSAAMFMATIAEKPEVYYRERAKMWRRALLAKTFDGRPLGSLGPVVLGNRLDRNSGPRAYQAIVYDKGSVVFSTLAERLGPERTWEMLGNIAAAVNGRVIRTSTFFRAMERLSGEDLAAFVRQYVRGVGMPALFYDHRFRRSGEGGWIVEGTVRQLPAEQFRYVVVATDSGWDVRRETVSEIDPAEWSTVVPYLIEVENEGTRTAVSGRLSITGESIPFSIPVEGKPREFQFDPFGQILANVQAENFEPRRYLCELGEHLARLGRYDEAQEILEDALVAELTVDETTEVDPRSTDSRELNARIRLARARLLLDRGELVPARSELRAAEKELPPGSNYYAGERAVLLARVHLGTSTSAAALAVLNEYVNENADVLSTLREDRLIDGSRMSSVKIARGEMLALLAVASHLAGDRDAGLFIRRADIGGVDMRALSLPPG